MVGDSSSVTVAGWRSLKDKSGSGYRNLDCRVEKNLKVAFVIHPEERVNSVESNPENVESSCGVILCIIAV